MPADKSQAPKKIFIMAGEVSGDLHGANLINHLKARSPFPLEIYGVGGDKIKATGAKEFYDLAHFHVTGLSAAIKKAPKYHKASKKIFASIERSRPDLVVLIDNPGFNLLMAKKIHALNIPIVYFIAPQVWAWGQKRVHTIKKYIKKVLVVFKFEKKFFEEYGVPVSWVGHPLKDIVEFKKTGKSFPLITLMPGSRKTELNSLLSLMLKTAGKIHEKMSQAKFQMIQSPNMSDSVYQKRVKDSSVVVELVKKNSYDAIASSDLVIVCSGTATLECAILGVPMIVTNKGSIVTYLAAKALIKVDCLGLPNLILGKKKFPEFLQFKATPEKISAEAVNILTNKHRMEEMKKDCAETSRLIGEKGASVRAADEVLALLS